MVNAPAQAVMNKAFRADQAVAKYVALLQGAPPAKLSLAREDATSRNFHLTSGAAGMEAVLQMWHMMRSWDHEGWLDANIAGSGVRSGFLGLGVRALFCKQACSWDLLFGFSESR